MVMRAERLIWIEDSRVKLVFDGVFACTTFGRGVRWFNAEDAEGEEDAEEGGRRKTGTWMGRMNRMRTGSPHWSPKRKRPGR